MTEDVDDEIDDEDEIEPAHLEEEKKTRGRKKKKDTPPKEKPEPSRGRGRPKGSRTRRNYHDEIQDQLELIFLKWYESDKICGGVALNRLPRIAQAGEDWLNGSDRARQLADKLSGKGGPIGLILAAWPIVAVAYMHHVKGASIPVEGAEQQPHEGEPEQPFQETETYPNAETPFAESAFG
jgi:hypothetical protein